MSEDLPQTGWDMAAQLCVDAGMPLAEARDLVISFFLEHGDMRAFSDWVLRGHQPGERVLMCIALMSCQDVSPSVAEALPFALERKKRGGGKKGSRPDPDLMIFRARVAELARDAGAGMPHQYEAGIQAVTDLLGDPKKHQTIRDAYDSYYSTRNKGK